MSTDESFLRRWSRLKRQTGETAASRPAGAPAPPAPDAAPVRSPTPLPDVDVLTFESDFTGFLQDHVEESLRKAALKKLFHSEAFNRMDGLDVYIEDYGKFEPLDEATLKQLAQARAMLFEGDAGESTTEGPAPGESGDEAPRRESGPPGPESRGSPAEGMDAPDTVEAKPKR